MHHLSALSSIIHMYTGYTSSLSDGGSGPLQRITTTDALHSSVATVVHCMITSLLTELVYSGFYPFMDLLCKTDTPCLFLCLKMHYVKTKTLPN
ncbi:hypothetical protein E2C01_087603 [Portunus trituberculatus]|uniref:Uncharacterized protein n=1 Tax=Portunus trituberculatus TaxID=210409 RepID=A0A5B7J3T9_PORTR|nr:hypothetical protein [Portunus trituberculatus]